MSSVHERIENALADTGITKVEAARRLGVSRSSIQSWTSGRYIPSTVHLRQIAELTGRSMLWLRHGEGAPESRRPEHRRDPLVGALQVAQEGALRLTHAMSMGTPVEKLAVAERALKSLERDEVFGLVIEARDVLARFIVAANESIEAGEAVDFSPLHAATTLLSQLGDNTPPVELIEEILKARERHATGLDGDGTADAKRQAARDASPEGTTDVLVIDDKWERLSEATQKAAKESKG